MINVEEAYQLIAENVGALPTEPVELLSATGRILAADITADVDSPPHRKSVMDGFAVRCADINAGNRRLKIKETVVAGSWPKQVVRTGEATRIMTGAPLPAGADAVVMIELTESPSATDQEFVVVNLESLQPNQHVLDRASNFAAGDSVFRSGHRIRPSDIGLLAEIGATTIEVGGRPSVAVLPTGDELVPCEQLPRQGQIRNSNGPMLIALAQQLGLPTTDLGIGRDDVADLQQKIQSGLQHDLFILSGGVSAGMLDLVPSLLKKAGVTEVFHKIKIKPGKPIWFGVLDRDGHRCHVFGLPGNPVSSLVGFHLFVGTAIRRMESDSDSRPESVGAILAEPHETRGDRPTYWPGRWGNGMSSTRTVAPLVWKGSSDLLALGSADGFIYFSGGTNRHEAGKEVSFFPLN